MSMTYDSWKTAGPPEHPILCDWCEEREADSGDDMCDRCWDERERLKAEGA